MKILHVRHSFNGRNKYPLKFYCVSTAAALDHCILTAIHLSALGTVVSCMSMLNHSRQEVRSRNLTVWYPFGQYASLPNDTLSFAVLQLHVSKLRFYCAGNQRLSHFAARCKRVFGIMPQLHQGENAFEVIVSFSQKILKLKELVFHPIFFSPRNQSLVHDIVENIIALLTPRNKVIQPTIYLLSPPFPTTSSKMSSPSPRFDLYQICFHHHYYHLRLSKS